MKFLIFSLFCCASVFGQGTSGPGAQSGGGGGGGITSVPVLPGTCTPGVTAPVQLTVSPGGIYVCAYPPYPPNTWLQQTNFINARDFGAKFNVKFAFGLDSTITYTNGSNIITCSTCNFLTTAKVGQTFFAANSCCTPDHTQTAVVQVPETTILSVDSNTQIHTVGNATATASGTQPSIAWGDYDDAAVVSAEAVWAAIPCSTLVLPTGAGFFKNGHFQTQNVVCTRIAQMVDYGATVRGGGFASTLLVPTPTFTFSTCVGGGGDICFGGTLSQQFDDFSVFGLGVGATGNNSKKVIGMGIGSVAHNVGCNSWGAQDTSLIGFDLNFSRGYNIVNDGCGRTAIQAETGQNSCFFCFGGDTLGPVLNVAGEFWDTNSQYGGITNGNLLFTFNNGSIYHGIGVKKFGGPASGGTCLYIGNSTNVTIYLEDSDIANCNGTLQNGIFSSSTGAVIHARDAQITGTAVAGGISLPVSNKLFDECGNTFSTTNTIGAGVVFGSCSATGTAAVATNVTPSTGWGTTGAAGNGVSAISGNTRLIQFTVTATGTPAANPTITVAFPTPFLVAPICGIRQVGGTGAQPTSPFVVSAPTASGSGAITWTGTPVAASTYIFQLSCDFP